MKSAKIAVVALGHYIYFDQFEGLREELEKKSAEFLTYLPEEGCEVVYFTRTPEISTTQIKSDIKEK